MITGHYERTPGAYLPQLARAHFFAVVVEKGDAHTVHGSAARRQTPVVMCDVFSTAKHRDRHRGLGLPVELEKDRAKRLNGLP